MRFSSRLLPGLLRDDGSGRAAIAPEAPVLALLVGASSGVSPNVEFAVLSAADLPVSPGAARACFRRLEALLPAGLEVLGVFVRDAASAEEGLRQVPTDVHPHVRIVAAAAADDSLIAWEVQSSAVLTPCLLDGTAAPWMDRWCIRGRLSIFVAAASSSGAAAELIAMAQGLGFRLRYVFPGSDQVLSLKELRAADQPLAPAVVGGAGPAAEPLHVELLAETLGGSGPTNFVDLQAVIPTEFSFDFAAYLPRGAGRAAAAEALAAAGEVQIRAAAAMCSGKDAKTVKDVVFRSFLPGPLGHVVSLANTEEPATRQELHQLLRLPQEPLLKPECALPSRGGTHPLATGKPVNPHLQCGQLPGWWKDGPNSKSAFTRGTYEYCHYMQDRFDDDGWGCAYRSLQTCVSWFGLQSYCAKPVPSIPDIQHRLKRVDEAHAELVVGSKQWIGTVEGMYVLQDYLGIDCRQIFCHDVDDMASNAPLLLEHLQIQGTPVMMGVGQKAFTLVGLCQDSSTGEVAFLIVDPHYTGADDITAIVQKGWVGWKNLAFFRKEAGRGFINVCLPLVPRGAEVL